MLCYNNECEQGPKAEQHNVGLTKGDTEFSAMFVVMRVIQIKSFYSLKPSK